MPGAAYEKIADASCSATPLRRRRDEWIEVGILPSAGAKLPERLRQDDRVRSSRADHDAPRRRLGLQQDPREVGRPRLRLGEQHERQPATCCAFLGCFAEWMRVFAVNGADGWLWLCQCGVR